MQAAAVAALSVALKDLESIVGFVAAVYVSSLEDRSVSHELSARTEVIVNRLQGLFPHKMFLT